MLMGTSVSHSEFLGQGEEEKKTKNIHDLNRIKSQAFIFKMLICFLHSVFIPGLVTHYPRIQRPLRTHKIAVVKIGKGHKRFLS